MIALALALAMMAADTPAAAEAAKAATPAKAAPTPNKDGMICVKEPTPGSRMKSRICMTKAEWDQRQRDDREMLDKAQTVKPLTF